MSRNDSSSPELEVLWWKGAMRDGDAQPHRFLLFTPPQPLGMDRGLMLPSETKLKDLSPAPHLFHAPLPRRWVPFTTIRWKCDTVRQNFHLGLHRGVEVCVTYFQWIQTAPTTAARACYDSFPPRAQKSIFSPWHFYSSLVILIFLLTHFFPLLLSFK